MFLAEKLTFHQNPKLLLLQLLSSLPDTPFFRTSASPLRAVGGQALCLPSRGGALHSHQECVGTSQASRGQGRSTADQVDLSSGDAVRSNS